MDMKEAIEKIEKAFYLWILSASVDERVEYEEIKKTIFELLRQGEKYRQMWEELFNTVHPGQMKQLFSTKSVFFPKDVDHYSLTSLENLKNRLQQKYFPKEATHDDKR